MNKFKRYVIQLTFLLSIGLFLDASAFWGNNPDHNSYGNGYGNEHASDLTSNQRQAAPEKHKEKISQQEKNRILFKETDSKQYYKTSKNDNE